MSQLTKVLGLILPDLNDEQHQTILDLAATIQKLDDAAELYEETVPTTRDWNTARKVWKTNPVAGGILGWICVRGGKLVPLWSTKKVNALDDLIMPTLNNGHYYKCIQPGTSAIEAPTFPVVSGSTVSDVHGATPWTATHGYKVGDIVLPSINNDRYYELTQNGVSGTTEPIWDTTDGALVYDNSAVWKCYKITIWQEQGVSALFKEFGKIEV
jgi:hypothetical protein